MKEKSLSRANITKAFVVIMVSLLLSMTCIPAFAQPTSAQRKKRYNKNFSIEWIAKRGDYVEAVVNVNEKTFHMIAKRYGDTWKVTNINGVEQHSSYCTITTIPRPPYPWWIWMGNVPAIRLYLDASTAMNTDTALAVIGLLAGIIGGIYGGPYGLIAAAVAGLMYISYDTLYKDHHPDGSWSLWVPVDWYNAFVYSYFHGLYMATCRYWWYFFAVPWNIGSHEYWS